jgi:CDP-glucose 4,6-dehydratase
VLEPLSGYLLLAQKMWEHPTEYCEGWNFGPEMDAAVSVWEVAMMLTKEMGRGELLDQTDPNAPHEANLLMLDITKARKRLGWQPRLRTAEAIALTSDWYKRYRDELAYDICVDEIRKFLMR